MLTTSQTTFSQAGPLSRSRFSPGQWFRRVPRSRNANLRYRKRILLAAREVRVQRLLMEMCKRDILFWINTFVWQFNPNSIGVGSEEIGPFVTWGFQDGAIMGNDAYVTEDGESVPEESGILKAIERRQDLLIEKSREMGASWLCLLVIVWLFLFHSNKKFLAISRNEKAVDAPEDPDSLFWKVRYVIEHLPSWMTAGRYSPRKLGFANPLLKSYINGQASTGKAGVGGRATAMFVDEFSQIEEDYEVLNRTSDTTKCRIFNGTHRGSGTAFYELAQRADMRKRVMHWTQHPDKRRGLYRFDAKENKTIVLDKAFSYPTGFRFVQQEAPTGGACPYIRSPWYDEECTRKASARAVAMDLDIDPEGSVSQFFTAKKLHDMKIEFAREPDWRGDLIYDSEMARPTGLVQRDKGPLKLWVHPRHNNTLAPGKHCIGCDLSTGSGATNSVAFICDLRTGEQVASYATPNLEPERFAPVVGALAYLFQDEWGQPAQIGWEIPGPGANFGKCIMELGFTNVIYRQLHSTTRTQDKLTAPGWVATKQSKLELLIALSAAMDKRHFIIREEYAYKEASVYRYDESGYVVHPQDEGGEDPTGARINHGDRIIGAGLCNKMMDGVRTPIPEQFQDVPYNSLAWRRKYRKDKARSYFK